jgi:hypothetical protein
MHLRQVCSPHRACVSDFEKNLGFWEKFPIPPKMCVNRRACPFGPHKTLAALTLQPARAGGALIQARGAGSPSLTPRSRMLTDRYSPSPTSVRLTNPHLTLLRVHFWPLASAAKMSSHDSVAHLGITLDSPPLTSPSHFLLQQSLLPVRGRLQFFYLLPFLLYSASRPMEGPVRFVECKPFF